MRMVRVREKVFRNSSGIRFNVSFVDCTILSTTEGATCPYMTNGLSYTFYATGETRSITSHITCYSKNVIYMVQSNRFNLQYIGETKRRLKDSFNEHRRAVETKIKSKPITVSEHFLSHTYNSRADMQLIPLEKIHSSRDSVPQGRESHLWPKPPWVIIVIHILIIFSFPVFFLVLYVISASPF